MKNQPPVERKPFMAINDLSKIFHNRMRRLAEDQGMNESYRHLLFHLSHKDGVTQLDLANLTHLKPPTISVTLRKMEQEGYVRRQQDENDQRAVRVFLTDKGKEFNRSSKKLIDSLDKQVVEGISNVEIKQLLDLLDRMYYNLTGEDPKERCCCRRTPEEKF